MSVLLLIRAIFSLCYFCVICVFCLLDVLARLSVTVQVTDWKDSSLKWPIINVLMGTLNPAHSVTRVDGVTESSRCDLLWMMMVRLTAGRCIPAEHWRANMHRTNTEAVRSLALVFTDTVYVYGLCQFQNISSSLQFRSSAWLKTAGSFVRGRWSRLQ